jgi:hypothetical protein
VCRALEGTLLYATIEALRCCVKEELTPDEMAASSAEPESWNLIPVSFAQECEHPARC